MSPNRFGVDAREPNAHRRVKLSTVCCVLYSCNLLYGYRGVCSFVCNTDRLKCSTLLLKITLNALCLKNLLRCLLQ